MKFGKRLKQQIEQSLPDWRDKYLSYKELKKLVKLISSAPATLRRSPELGKAAAEFMYLLNNEIEKFNAFFMEQEEDFVIRHKVRASLVSFFFFLFFFFFWCFMVTSLVHYGAAKLFSFSLFFFVSGPLST